MLRRRAHRRPATGAGRGARGCARAPVCRPRLLWLVPSVLSDQPCLKPPAASDDHGSVGRGGRRGWGGVARAARRARAGVSLFDMFVLVVRPRVEKRGVRDWSPPCKRGGSVPFRPRGPCTLARHKTHPNPNPNTTWSLGTWPRLQSRDWSLGTESRLQSRVHLAVNAGYLGLRRWENSLNN